MKSHADAIIDLYERHATRYIEDRARVLSSESGWLERFSAFLPRNGTVLDIGCGCGEPVARYLIERGFEVEGADASPTLIARCREQFPQQIWRIADMRSLDLGRIFDGILAWDSFFHLAHDDQRRMFRVFAQHAAPGAALMFTSGPAHGEAIGSYRGEPLYHASLAPAEYRRLLNSHGFRVEAHVEEDPDCGRHTVWLARRELAGVESSRSAHAANSS
jgi:SAM-dependent methyltransferase